MIVIYTDGSTLKNGAKDAKGGFGVVVCEAEPHQDPSTYKVVAAYSERADGTTNNRMEMSAILWALTHYGAKDGDFFIPIVYSDSMYCVNSFTNWIKNWKANGWRTSEKQPVKNVELLQELDAIVSQFPNIQFVKVKGHSDNYGNIQADRLCNEEMDKLEVN